MIAILHINTELTWRGGENQLALLTKYVGSRVTNHLAVANASALHNRLQDSGVPLLMLNSPRDIVRSSKALANYCKRKHIAIVHTHASKAHWLGLAVKLLQPQVKLVVHRRVDDMPGRNPFHKVKYLHRGNDRFICVSRVVKDRLKRFGVADAKLRIVRSSTESSVLGKSDKRVWKKRYATLYGVPEDRPWIACVAALTKQKDHGTLLDAVRVLKEGGHEICLLVAGTGPLESKLRDQARRLG